MKNARKRIGFNRQKNVFLIELAESWIQARSRWTVPAVTLLNQQTAKITGNWEERKPKAKQKQKTPQKIMREYDERNRVVKWPEVKAHWNIDENAHKNKWNEQNKWLVRKIVARVDIVRARLTLVFRARNEVKRSDWLYKWTESYLNDDPRHRMLANDKPTNGQSLSWEAADRKWRASMMMKLKAEIQRDKSVGLMWTIRAQV
jgi:hypothetical protein